MSDYPRPSEPPTPPFLPDRLVGGLYILLFLGNFGWWSFGMLRRYRLSTILQDSVVYVAAYLLLALLYLWLLVLVANGRRGGFLWVGILLSLFLVGAVYIRNLPALAYNFPLWTYCVARIFGSLGQKPQ